MSDDRFSRNAADALAKAYIKAAKRQHRQYVARITISPEHRQPDRQLANGRRALVFRFPCSRYDWDGR
jgi:hypothetical protein